MPSQHPYAMIANRMTPRVDRAMRLMSMSGLMPLRFRHQIRIQLRPMWMGIEPLLHAFDFIPVGRADFFAHDRFARGHQLFANHARLPRGGEDEVNLRMQLAFT